MKKLMGLCLFSCMFFAGLSCSPQKKLERLVERYPALLHKDTITDVFILRDTLFSKTHMFDTVIVTKMTDTAFFQKGSLKTSLVRNHDTIFIKSIYTGDTIFYEKTIERNVPVEKINYVKPDNLGLFIKTIPYIACTIILIIISAIIFRK